MGFICFDKEAVANGRSGSIQLDGLDNFLALYNRNVYWIVPKTGKRCEDIPVSTQFLLWRKKGGGYCVMLPLVNGDLKAAVCGCENGVYVTIQGAVSEKEPETAELLYVQQGENPYELVNSAVSHVSEKLGSFRMRTEKKVPGFMDSIGWCTWDAFYGEVDDGKVIMGLESFKKAGFPLGFMILDDGAWDVDREYLNRASVSKAKFPNGLRGLTDASKKRYGLKMFGVWHCFPAYWCGINPEGELAKKYSYMKSYADIRPWLEEDTSQDVFMITPDDIGKFYEELHSYLYGEGVDMLKIDGQSSLELFTAGKIGQGTAMKKYQRGMQETAEKYFNSNVIHCMSNSVDVAYNMLSTNCWRNSDDYIPRDLKMQKEHIYTNAMNALWTSTFSFPDWDMFQTHSAGAEMHAAARALSGGPVYVCDYPGRQDFDILNRLIISDGVVLRCPQPALPTEDCIFEDCRYDKKLLKIYNTNGRIGTLGIFNCNVEPERIRRAYSAVDINGIAGDRFAVYSFISKRLTTAGRNDLMEITLDDGEYDIITFSPIENGVAPLGLTGKYNSSAAVEKFEWKDGSFHARIKDGGEIAFYCDRKPARVSCRGEKANYSYDSQNGLLCVNSKKMGSVDIKIDF